MRPELTGGKVEICMKSVCQIKMVHGGGRGVSLLEDIGLLLAVSPVGGEGEELKIKITANWILLAFNGNE